MQRSNNQLNSHHNTDRAHNLPEGIAGTLQKYIT